MNENNDLPELNFPVKRNSYEKEIDKIIYDELQKSYSEDKSETNNAEIINEPLPEIRIVPASAPEKAKPKSVGIIIAAAIAALCAIGAGFYLLFHDNGDISENISENTQDNDENNIQEDKPSETETKSTEEKLKKLLYRSLYNDEGLLIIGSDSSEGGAVYYDGSFDELYIRAHMENPDYSEYSGRFTISEEDESKVYSQNKGKNKNIGFDYFLSRFSSAENGSNSLYEFTFTDSEGKALQALCVPVGECRVSETFSGESDVIQFTFDSGAGFELSDGNWRCTDENEDLYGEYEANEFGGIKMRCHTLDTYSPELCFRDGKVYIVEYILEEDGTETSAI